MRILTRLKEINPEAKDTYDNSYDLRVQADYGKEAKILPLNEENMKKIFRKTKKLVKDSKKLVGIRELSDSD